MSFGLTTTGYTIKRIEDIKAEIEDTILSTFGTSVNLDPRGPIGQIIGIFAEREALIWELSEQVYNSQFPATAEGKNLDNVLSLVGLVRKQATFSRATLRIFGQAGTLIPAASIVSSDLDADIKFVTQADVNLILGTGTDEVQTLTFDSVPDSGSFTLDFEGDITSAILFSDNAAAVETAIESVPGITDVNVTGDFSTGFTVTFTGSNDGEQPRSNLIVNTNTLELTSTPVNIAIVKTTPGVFPNEEILALSDTAGAIAAPAGSLEVIDTPVSGWESVTNELDAEIGDDRETDAEAKLRRDETLQAPGKATLQAIRADILTLDEVDAVLAFENTSLVVDQFGRPPKSFEMIVQGGQDIDIATVIFDNKPAGILSFGSTTLTLQDSQGFDHDISFSRPTLVPIWLEVDLVTTANFPLDGDTQVRNALLAFGENLNISEDVLEFQVICAVNDAGIAGIKDVDIRLGAAPMPAAGSVTPAVASDDSGDLLWTATGHGLAVNNRVTFTNSGGALPTGVFATQIYFVVDVPSVNEFKIAVDRNDTPIQFVDAGTGTHTVNYGGLEENITIELVERADFDNSRITTTIV